MASKLINSRRRNSITLGRHILMRAANVADANDMLNEAVELLTEEIPNLTTIKITSDSGTINIDTLRQYSSAMSLKSAKNERLLIVIYDAVDMTPEAQNSLLKDLEDSINGKQFLLAGDYTNRLLPTVVSRTDIIDYTPEIDAKMTPSENALFKASGYSHSSLQAYKQSPDELSFAKKWVSSTTLERIVLTKDIKTADAAKKLIDNLLVVYRALLESSYKSSSTKAVKSLVQKIDALDRTSKRLDKISNVRLNLTQLSLLI